MYTKTSVPSRPGRNEVSEEKSEGFLLSFLASHFSHLGARIDFLCPTMLPPYPALHTRPDIASAWFIIDGQWGRPGKSSLPI